MRGDAPGARASGVSMPPCRCHHAPSMGGDDAVGVGKEAAAECTRHHEVITAQRNSPMLQATTPGRNIN